MLRVVVVFEADMSSDVEVSIIFGDDSVEDASFAGGSGSSSTLEHLQSGHVHDRDLRGRYRKN